MLDQSKFSEKVLRHNMTQKFAMHYSPERDLRSLFAVHFYLPQTALTVQTLTVGKLALGMLRFEFFF